jgi:hypothetical protein
MVKIAFATIAGIFPISTRRPTQATEQEESSTHYTVREKNVRSEIFFLYIIHGSSLVIGLMTFSILRFTYPEYVNTLDKVEAASGVSIFLAVYCGGPLGLAASIILRLLYPYCQPWKAATDPPSCCTPCCTVTSWFCVPWPKSTITTRMERIPGFIQAETPAAELHTTVWTCLHLINQSIKDQPRP